MIGTTISHYRILEKLGGGGMGVVYKAHDTKLNRTVALKFLPPHLASDEQDKKRFVREAKAASSLDHPNICNVHEIDETADGRVFIAMSLYEGMPLNKIIEKGPLKIDEALDIASQVAEGLQAAHEKGIVHRDIKSSNIIQTDKGRAVIMDFGLAQSEAASKLTKTGSTLGTVLYMSPEQARGEKVDRRTDLWSLGVVLYEMVAGRLPFISEYHESVVYSILNEAPPPITGLRSGVPMELERIVNKCCEKNLTERYQHVDDLLADLRSVQRKMTTGEGTRETVVAKRWKKRSLGVFGSMAVVVVAVILGILYFPHAEKEAFDSIAVLPLDNLSGDPSQEYFSDGMTDALITELQRIRSLRVISRTSVKQYKGTTKTLPEIARELNVKAVVEGSVLRDGDNVRINVQLIQASPEKHLWASMFDRSMMNILALQSEVAKAIAQEIKIKITPLEQRGMTESRAVDAQAYEAFLRGRYYSDKRTEESFRKSIEYFEKAIEIDSVYALAYAGLADSYNLLARYGHVFPKEGFLKAKAAARRALVLDNTLAQAYTSLAFLEWYYEFDHQTAEHDFRRAIELNPSYETAHHWYAIFLSASGRHDEAIREITLAHELDPLSMIINTNLGYVHYFAGNYEKAVEKFRRAIEIDSTFGLAHLRLGLAYEQLGKDSEAAAEFQKATHLAEGTVEAITGLAHLFAVAGRSNDARKVLRRLISMRSERYVSSYGIAVVHVALSENEEALQWFEKAFEEHDSWLMWLMVDPRLNPIRMDSRFKALSKRLDFPE